MTYAAHMRATQKSELRRANREVALLRARRRYKGLWTTWRGRWIRSVAEGSGGTALRGGGDYVVRGR